MLTPDIIESTRKSVLCWLATADARGAPNVSPKEIFAVFDDQHLVIANIASPQSAANIAANPQVCVSLVDIFAQKGFKLTGTALDVPADAPAFARWAAPVLEKAGPRRCWKRPGRGFPCAASLWSRCCPRRRFWRPATGFTPTRRRSRRRPRAPGAAMACAGRWTERRGNPWPGAICGCHPTDPAAWAGHRIRFIGGRHRMKAVYIIVSVTVVGALFLVLRGLFSAWALLEMAWSAIFGLVNRF